MEALTLAQLLQAVGGTLIGGEADLNQTVTEVCTDSRSVPQGCLFLPLEGERFDGHSFINSALEQGAVGCITARERESYLPGTFYIKVRSTQRALRDLARYYKEMFHIPFVAVTGSVGKTTTKDMVAAVLGAKYKVLKTEGNFNNDIGLPLTLLRLDHTHQICVLEMGMDHAGEIDYLSELVEPDVALITNVGDSHIENLGSREAIFAAKCEIFNHLKADGTAILNGDDPMLATLKGKLPQTTYMVGSGAGLDYTAFDIDSDGASHISCQVKTPHSKFQADIPALGTHMIYPTLMATAVGELFGMEADEITRGIRAFLPTKMRMNVVNCPGDVVILNDAYNANPQSMRAAAAVLGDAKDRRRVAVVGDMKELGANSAMFHQAVGGYFAQAGVERLIVTSTSEVYGTAQRVPIDETHPKQPQSPYSATKIGADAIAESFYHAFGLPVVVARPFNTYGPRQSARAIIPSIITQIAAGKREIKVGDLSPTRDFNYVYDTCRGFIALAKTPNIEGQEINICSKTEISMSDLFSLIAALMHADVKWIQDPQRVRPKNSEVFRLFGDNTKIQTLTNWRPRYTLAEGLKETIAWFTQPENLAKYKYDIYNR